MRALWQATVAVQLDDVVHVKTQTQRAIAAADSARTDAELRVELLRHLRARANHSNFNVDHGGHANEAASAEKPLRSRCKRMSV
ncbi:hypothetical protein [Burkholderia sp. Bp8963]|uniref:hypothetical protein n=1 Tax=Burkholderia sp. Bp8963 TaxID=2184547 RepID=UPI0021AB8D3C|nr:hypothetical protein [Burkholderia sp. Bp8963]